MRACNVTDEEIAVKIEGHEHEIRSLKHRMEEQEEQTKTLNNLALSVQKLAINMEQMLTEQKDQGKRIETLEKEPAERWNSAKRTAFTTVVSVVAGALATGLLIMIGQYV